MLSYNTISTFCLVVVALSSGAHAEEEAAQTFGLLGAGLYGSAGVGVGLYGPGVGVGGVGVGGVGAGVGVGGAGVDVDGYNGYNGADDGAAANVNAGATASATANANAGATPQYRKLRFE